MLTQYVINQPQPVKRHWLFNEIFEVIDASHSRSLKEQIQNLLRIERLPAYRALVIAKLVHADLACHVTTRQCRGALRSPGVEETDRALHLLTPSGQSVKQITRRELIYGVVDNVNA